MSAEELSLESRRLQIRQEMWNRRQVVAGRSAKLKPVLSTPIRFPRSSLIRALSDEKGRKIALAAATAIFARKKLRWVAIAAIAGVAGYIVIKEKLSSDPPQD